MGSSSSQVDRPPSTMTPSVNTAFVEKLDKWLKDVEKGHHSMAIFLYDTTPLTTLNIGITQLVVHAEGVDECTVLTLSGRLAISRYWRQF